MSDKASENPEDPASVAACKLAEPPDGATLAVVVLVSYDPTVGLLFNVGMRGGPLNGAPPSIELVLDRVASEIRAGLDSIIKTISDAAGEAPIDLGAGPGRPRA